jgi:predicted DNA-binding transcriptional regulator AlpA
MPEPTGRNYRVRSAGAVQGERTNLALEGAKAINSERLLTARDVSQYLSLPYKKVYDVVGHLALALGARRLRWRRPDIDAWLDGQQRSP